MKASRLAKLETQLAATESELCHLLSTVLPRTAKAGDSLFFNSAFLPEGHLPHWLPKESESLLSMANDSIALREQLGVPVQGSPGELYLSACREAFNFSNPNRRGPRQLAAWLLSAMPSPFAPNYALKRTVRDEVSR